MSHCSPRNDARASGGSRRDRTRSEMGGQGFPGTCREVVGGEGAQPSSSPSPRGPAHASGGSGSAEIRLTRVQHVLKQVLSKGGPYQGNVVVQKTTEQGVKGREGSACLASHSDCGNVADRAALPSRGSPHMARCRDTADNLTRGLATKGGRRGCPTLVVPFTQGAPACLRRLGIGQNSSTNWVSMIFQILTELGVHTHQGELHRSQRAARRELA